MPKNTMSEVEKFKAAVPKVRDILRSCSVTGMDSMRHICLYMVGPYLTLKNVKELCIPEKFAWENRYDLLKGDEDINLQAFGTEMIDHIDRLFGTQKFTFEVKSGTKHKEIMEILSSINMQDVDLHMDVLGYIYEQHLKTGSSAARDLGQFFTDRFICEYMVKLCEPKFKYEDVPESVCDPTMGTGGFLTAYLKYFKDKNVDWSKHQTQIHGVDHDSKVAGVSRLNMFMESKGQVFKHLHNADSLHGGLDPTSYDIILANMPFGLKGLKYVDVHSSIKSLHIDGTKSEPLFLQLMMVSLNKGGRCAVVVPEGMLVNTSKCHNGTRKYLFENFEVKRVIKMKGKFFMNTGIQPSILFFENSGKKTEKVEFWDVDRDDKGNFTEEMVLSVPVEKFDETYVLQPEKYITIVNVYINTEVQIKKIEDVFDIEKGSLQSSKNIEGEYKFITASDDFKTHNVYTHDLESLLIVGGSEGSLAKVHYFKGKFIASDLMYILTLKEDFKDKINYKYIWYYLRRIRENIINNNLICMGTTKRSISKERCGIIEIRFPSLEIQNKTVEELDSIYETKQDASNMIEKLKKQMKSIVQTIDFRNYESKLLENICEHNNGKPITGKEKELGGDYNVMGGGMDYNGTYTNYNREGENISVSKSGASAGFVKYHTSKYWAGDCFTMTPVKEELYIKYIYYYLKNNQYLTTSKTSGSTIPHCKWDDVKTLLIPVPPLEVQQEIVRHLDALNDQIECLQKIESQADENAKFVLDGYLGV